MPEDPELVLPDGGLLVSLYVYQIVLYISLTEAKEATCVAEGNIEYYTCSECNKKFSDGKGKTEVTEVIIPIDEDAHNWNEWIIEKEATVDEAGQKTRTCKNNEEHKETQEISKIPYAITEGDNQTCYYDNDEDLIIIANASLEKLIKVLVDGKELEKENYELKSGSTIITLKSEYLDTLDEGEHKLTLAYTDGEINAKFKIGRAHV